MGLMVTIWFDLKGNDECEEEIKENKRLLFFELLVYKSIYLVHY